MMISAFNMLLLRYYIIKTLKAIQKKYQKFSLLLNGMIEKRYIFYQIKKTGKV